MEIVSVAQIQAIERKANESGISYRNMMENAGRGVAEWIKECYPNNPNVIGLVGSGNNGGDTLIGLTILSQWGFRTTAFLAKNRKNDDMMESYIESGGSIIDISNGENLENLEVEIIPGSIILDGILGTGLKLPLRGQLKEVMGEIYQLVKKSPGGLVVAVDCPSGIDCDTGEVSEVTLTAHHTLSMAATKQGLMKHPARGKSGQLHVINIGIGNISEFVSNPLPEVITKEIVKTFLPARPSTGHKGTFGTCLVIAGTLNYTGAAYLTGKAAYRGGCGLVHIATLESVHANLAGHLVEAIWTVLPDLDGYYDPSGIKQLPNKLSQVDSLVVGPGWGLNENNVKFLNELINVIPENLPTVFDADGLKLLKKIPKWWKLIPRHTLLTPHPGEMAILSDLSVDEIQSNRWEVASSFAKKWGLTLILKGAETVVADQNGEVWINPVSDSALATAGSGDVLSGLLGGLLAQNLPTLKAATLSTFLHAQAGILAKCRIGTNISVTALDILDSIAESFSVMR